MYSIAFTGHRPKKLGGYDWKTPKNQRIGRALKLTILKEMKSIDEKNFTFYFGGALGTDQMAFELVDFIAKQHPEYNITKVLCVPFRAQPNKWPQASKELFQSQCERAEKVVYVDEEANYRLKNYVEGIYHPEKLFKRNEYMVDNCDTLIAVFNGEQQSGTASCIKYADKHDKHVIYINPDNC